MGSHESKKAPEGAFLCGFWGFLGSPETYDWWVV